MTCVLLCLGVALLYAPCPLNYLGPPAVALWAMMR